MMKVNNMGVVSSFTPLFPLLIFYLVALFHDIIYDIILPLGSEC